MFVQLQTRIHLCEGLVCRNDGDDERCVGCVAGAQRGSRTVIRYDPGDYIKTTIQYIEAAAEWCEYSWDVLHVSPRYVFINQTLTVSLRENHLETKASLTKSCSYYQHTEN